MTSSLVGSEMCIRDRPYRDFFNFHRTSGWATPSLTSNVGGFTSMTPSSVSYTHLTLPTICSV
eukprot:10137174-Prorocentrum_lima.AAC.1